MKVLLIIASDSGTIARVSCSLYKALIKAGHEVKTICFSHDEEKAFNFGELYLPNSFHVPLISFITDKIVRIRYISKIKKQFHPDVTISTQVGCDALNALSTGPGMNIGIVHAKLSQIKQGSTNNYLFIKFAYRHLFRRFNKIIGISKEIVLDLQKNAREVNAQLAYNIHDIDAIRESGKEELDNEKEKDIFTKDVILFVGSLYAYIKAPLRLLQAFYSLNKNVREKCNLVFIGSDKEGMVEVMEEFCKEKDINNVYYLGEKTNPYKYIEKSRMLVSPSRDEGLPGVQIEALVLGTPVVSTNSSIGVWEIMECDSNYVSKLSDNYISDYGVITPNMLMDENKTVKYLSEGISYVLHHDFDRIEKFDSSRFRDVKVVNEYLLSLGDQ